MRRISDFGFRIACRVIVPRMLLAAMPMIAVAQSQPAHTPLDSAAAQTTQAFRPQVRTTFARSASKAGVMIGPINLPSMELDLRAYGRVWATRMALREKDVFTAEFDVPVVRVPTVFSVTPALLPNTELARIVAYPDRDIAWDKKIILYSLDAPPWFIQWAAATGLPVKQVGLFDKPVAESERDTDTKALILVGRSTAGKDLTDVARLVENTRINVLVLEADWLGDAAGPVEVGGGQMRGDLLVITGKQTWAGGLEFRSHRQPCGTIANRWAWIADRDGLPLVEAIAAGTAPPEAARSVVLSYLSWAEQLGRREEADELLRATLVAAAEASVLDVAWRSLNFVHPKRDKIDYKDRPVLAAAASTVRLIIFKDLPWLVHVVDVRGTDRLPEGLREELKALESRVGADAESWLILGDDPMLDEWEWLKLDRAKKTIHRPGVVWLSDDELPPSKENQIRLMLTLTELGVPLAPPDQEETSHEN